MNYRDQSEIIKNAVQFNAFNQLYDTVIQNRRWIEVKLIQQRLSSNLSVLDGSSMLDDSSRTEISILLS